MLEFYRRLAEGYSALGWVPKALLFLGICAVTTAGGIAVVLWLPPDHFVRPDSGRSWWRQHPVLRATGIVLKNALGLVVLPLGVLMALPLVPGPGLVFILIGLSLLDFPGKKRLERRLLDFPSVRRFLNDVRQAFGKPSLIFAVSEQQPPSSAPSSGA